jgi:hypothetical protein
MEPTNNELPVDDPIEDLLGLPGPSQNIEPEGTDPAIEPNYILGGEALAAVTGPFWQGPITPTQGEEAEALITEIEKAAAKFCRFGKFDDFKLPPKSDYEEVWGQLQPLTDEDRDAADDLAEPEIIEAWAATVDRARAYAREVWPVSIRQTPTGPDWLEPSRTVGGKADAILAVLKDPRELLRELNRGSMTPSQVDAVRSVYPELFSRILIIFDVSLKSTDKNCPWDHEVLLRRLYGLPPIGLVTFKATGPETDTSVDVRIDFEGLKTKNQTVK